MTKAQQNIPCLLNGMQSEKCQKTLVKHWFFKGAPLRCQKSVSKTLFTARCVPEAIFSRFSLDFGSLGDSFGTSGGLPGGFWSLLAALWAPLGGLLGAPGTLLDALGRLLGRS